MSTEGWMPVARPVPAIAPPLELQPARSPFLISALPTTATVNPDTIRNATVPGIPSYRITPPPPITQSSGATNAIATVSKVARLVQPTPAPTISSPLATIPTGYQFSFLQVRLPLQDTVAISSYKIYRNTANNSASASVIQSVIHHQANVGIPVIIQDSQPNGVTQFYWVSAVNNGGQESSLVPAQSASVKSNAIANSNSQIASSAHMNTLNANFTPLAGSVLSNDGTTENITVSANLNQFSFSQVGYNSGTVAPTSFGSSYIFADDPQFQGGAVIYQSSLSPASQTADDGRMNFGSITTSSTGTTTGGGFSGGTSGLSGGRGFALASS